MKHLITLIMIVTAFAALGCSDDDKSVVEIDQFPAAPQGVFSITGDGAVWVLWNGSYESDINYYRVYRSLQATTGYAVIGSVDHVLDPDELPTLHEFIDNSPINGTTYWYAVTAVDNAGQESVLSGEWVFDTPRPEGNGTLLPYNVAPTAAGFNLATETVLEWNSVAADFWIDRTADTIESVVYVTAFINAGLYTEFQTDIQDMGYTSTFDAIGWAPTDGWSALGYAEAIVGHTYVIWTSDDHYAKIRVTGISASGAVSFQWAYQTAPANLELAPMQRPERDEPLAKPTVTMQLLK